MAPNFSFTDAEELLNGIEGFLKADLNTCIASINTKKNAGLPPEDVITLDPFADEEYNMFFRGVPTTQNVLFIGTPEITSVSNGGQLSNVLSLGIAIMIADSTDNNDYIKSFRYMLALQKVFQVNVFNIDNVQQIMIESQTPFIPASEKNKVIFKNNIMSGVLLNFAYV